MPATVVLTDDGRPIFVRIAEEIENGIVDGTCVPSASRVVNRPRMAECASW